MFLLESKNPDCQPGPAGGYGSRIVAYGPERQSVIGYAGCSRRNKEQAHDSTDQEGEVKTRAYGTTVPALEELKQWLIQEAAPA